jgi:hypothetical protein
MSADSFLRKTGDNKLESKYNSLGSFDTLKLDYSCKNYFNSI